jgi:hypothetical protein
MFIKKNSFIFIIGLVIFLFSKPSFSAENSQQSGFLQKQVDQLLKTYSVYLHDKNWQTQKKENGVSAFKVGKNFRNIVVEIKSHSTNSYYILNVAIRKIAISEIEKVSSRKFKFRKTKHLQKRIKQVVLPYLLKGISAADENSDYNAYYDFIFSAGYARMHNSKEIYPENKKGNLFFNTRVTYNPHVNNSIENSTAKLGEYMMVELDIKFSSPRESQNRPLPFDEFFFDFNILLYGKNSYNPKTKTGTLHGFFTSMEFYKPGLGSKIGDTGYDPHAITWDQDIYHDEPFVQFTTWRMLRYGFIATRHSGSAKYTLAADLGFGPSINSSLAANNIADGSVEENNLSRIFKSTKGRKENYYNSYVVPATFSVLADNLASFRLGFDYKFYYFFPMEKESAYDILNIVKCSLGYYFTDTISFNTRYEYWHVKSKLEDKHESHFWNRLSFDLTYSI